MRMKLVRAAVVLGATGTLLFGLTSPAQANSWRQGGHHNEGRSVFGRDRFHGFGPGWHRRPDAGPTVIARGLNNPRQLSLPVDQALLIAEAGKGGPDCSGTGEDETCVGTTGSVTAKFLPQWNGTGHSARIVTGLASAGGPDGSFAVGSDGVSQRLGGPLFVQETYAPPDVLPAPIAEQAGKLLAARPFRAPQTVADISAYELAHDPDGMGIDSNPYAVLALRDKVLVADAAANTVFQVDRHGTVAVFHVFHNIVNDVTTTATDEFPGFDPTPAFPGINWVPTSLAEGPHGEIYVGGLAGELPGQAQVVQLNPYTGSVVRTWTGFTTITGIAVGRDGSLYVSQLEAPEAAPINPMVVGVLTKVAPNGTHTDKDVPFPAGVAVDSWNNVYVAAFSGSPDTGLAGAPAGADTSGQVWRLRF
jgi:hypothetical protein